MDASPWSRSNEYPKVPKGRQKSCPDQPVVPPGLCGDRFSPKPRTDVRGLCLPSLRDSKIGQLQKAPAKASHHGSRPAADVGHSTVDDPLATVRTGTSPRKPSHRWRRNAPTRRTIQQQPVRSECSKTASGTNPVSAERQVTAATAVSRNQVCRAISLG